MKEVATEKTVANEPVFPFIVKAILFILLTWAGGAVLVSAPFWDDVNVWMESQ